MLSLQRILAIILLMCPLKQYSQMLVNAGFIKYNYLPFKIFIGSENMVDTLNICRIRSNGIKALKIYRIKNAYDSLLLDAIVYDSTGNIKNIEPSRGWFLHYDFKVPPISCRYNTFREKHHSYKDTTIKEKHRKYIVTSVYDSEGYLISPSLKTLKDLLIKNLLSYC